MSDYLGDFVIGENIYIERCFIDGSSALPTAVTGGSACCKNMQSQILLNSGVGAITTSGGLATLTIFTGSGASYVKGDYSVYMGAGTVTGTSVIGYTLAQFSLGRRSAVTLSANVVSWNGTAVSTPATAGIPDVNVKNINNVSASSVTTINANQGTTQPISFTGTGASALVKGDTVDWAGASVASAASGIPKVDVDTIKTNPVVNGGTITFPTTATLASTTNITAGTITTVTNLTNAPTAGDFTATMKAATLARVTLVDTLTTYTGNTVQTGDSFARIGVAGAGLTNIDLPNQTMDIVGNITGNLSGSVGSVTGAVGSVTGNVGGSVVGSVASVTAGCTLTAAYDFAKGTVAMVESYAADTATMTPVQALHMIWANDSQFAITTTSISVKKLDGTTEAMNFNLDSATTPTLRDRNV